MTRYRKGEWLEVSFKGMVQADSRRGVYTMSAGCDGEVTLPLDDPEIKVTRVGPNFEPDTVWADRDGLLWLCQWAPAPYEQDDEPELKLVSVLGTYSIPEAVDQYSPFRQVPIKEV